MSKKSVSFKNKQIGSHRELYLEQQENPLPPADELAAYNQLDPTLIPWLKANQEKEQSFRHDAVNNRIKTINRHGTREFCISLYGMTLAFVLLAGFGYGSYMLLMSNHEIIGSVFGGVTLLGITSLFITRTKFPKQKEDTPPV